MQIGRAGWRRDSVRHVLPRQRFLEHGRAVPRMEGTGVENWNRTTYSERERERDERKKNVLFMRMVFLCIHIAQTNVYIFYRACDIFTTYFIHFIPFYKICVIKYFRLVVLHILVFNKFLFSGCRHSRDPQLCVVKRSSAHYFRMGGMIPRAGTAVRAHRLITTMAHTFSEPPHRTNKTQLMHGYHFT